MSLKPNGPKPKKTKASDVQKSNLAPGENLRKTGLKENGGKGSLGKKVSDTNQKSYAHQTPAGLLGHKGLHKPGTYQKDH